MLPYVLPKERTSPQVAPKTAYLISSGDLRQTSCLASWPTQKEVEKKVTAVFKNLGWDLVRANEEDPDLGHGLIRSQRMGLLGCRGHSISAGFEGSVPDL